ncbi:hypothetical protein ACLOJK_010824 [Asimina triloba]
MTTSRGKGGMKVKIIETQFVKTDPFSFKSVVQSLTGKESTAGEKTTATATAAAAAAVEERVRVEPKEMNGGASCGKNLQLEELERMVVELEKSDDFLDLRAY